MTQGKAPVAPAKINGEVAVKELSHSERFSRAVEQEFTSSAGQVNLTGFQRKLCQNYFIKIDSVLRDAEIKRLKKAEKYRDPLPLTWANVNMQKLAVDVIAFSAVGMDPTQDNHINPIPYKNNNTNKYDITFIPGYKGIEIKARKYGFEVPDEVVVEVVYSNDLFREFKKDKDNSVESYEFKIVSPFDRGEVIGGFYYHQYFKYPEKNKIKTFSKRDIDKRKPEYASAEFWGGEKDNWVYDQASGKSKKEGTVQVEGWYDEMAYKTIYRAAYKAITIDSEKIDENYLAVIQREREGRDLQIELEIKSNANKDEIGFQDDNNNQVVDQQTGEVIDLKVDEQPPKETNIVEDNPEPETNSQKQQPSVTQIKAPFA